MKEKYLDLSVLEELVFYGYTDEDENVTTYFDPFDAGLKIAYKKDLSVEGEDNSVFKVWLGEKLVFISHPYHENERDYYYPGIWEQFAGNLLEYENYRSEHILAPDAPAPVFDHSLMRLAKLQAEANNRFINEYTERCIGIAVGIAALKGEYTESNIYCSRENVFRLGEKGKASFSYAKSVKYQDFVVVTYNCETVFLRYINERGKINPIGDNGYYVPGAWEDLFDKW
ncbi:hypothetical protein IKW73_03205 [Candidatus Saccharibacteria bacterium]|nr:hypothetical protein [Candidatus Saccharibacteria bacterium]